MSNGHLTAVIDALDAPEYLAPSGGSVLDLVARRAGTGDQLNLVFQGVGILPHDAARYEKLELLDQSPRRVAVVVRGRLDLRPEIQIVTLYELRPCEPGLRIRTEIYHDGSEPLAVFPSDGLFWGDREVTPFIPLPGRGFVHPDLDLEQIGKAMRQVPFVAAQSHTSQGSSYAMLACGQATLTGFHSETLSAVGLAPRILMPGDSVAFERFLIAGGTPGLQDAASLAMDARARMFGERYARVSGRILDGDGQPLGGDERAASLLFYEPGGGEDPHAASARTPWTEAVPDAAGRFQVLLPAGRTLAVEPHALGRPATAPVVFATQREPLDLGAIALPRVGTLEVTVSDASGAPLVAEVVLTRVRDGGAAEPVGSVHGVFVDARCDPYLGPPHGASPACNRTLVGPSGRTSFAVPEGTYYVYVTHGPFWTLARRMVQIQAAQRATLGVSLSALPILPKGALSADFHVHAGASFDSSLPERDRALTFLAAGVDVIAATDHDVITDYAAVLDELGIAERVHVMPGVETTGHILFLEPPGADVPRVIGHFNFWPLQRDPALPRNGAPDTQRIEPGTLFERMAPRYRSPGVAQLNHPFGEATLGRDIGYLAAVGYDPRVPVPASDDGTAAGQLARRPSGTLSNLDYDVQEVMNGYDMRAFLRYRAAWHSFLSQGIRRAGTANSDSHTLDAEVLGYPRNLVLGGHTLAGFDEARFDADVRAGHMLGTNGPIIEACVTGRDGSCHAPSLTPLVPAAGASLQIEVRAAPWIPVEQVRVLANGRVTHAVAGPELAHPGDPFSAEGTLRYKATIPLDDVAARGASAHDSWLVVEAGETLPTVVVDDDGLPEVEHDRAAYGRARPAECDLPDASSSAPAPAETPPRASRCHLDAVAPGVRPTAFTNPWLLDFAGNGWDPPGLTP